MKKTLLDNHLLFVNICHIHEGCELNDSDW